VYRNLSLLQRHRWQIALITATILLQAGLIAGLLYERRQRQAAEVLARQRMADLAHANRFSTVGQFTATISHELGQPLGSILANAEAAELMLNAANPNIDEIKNPLTDIVREDHRASEIIRHTRSLMKKAPFELKNIDLNDIVQETINFVSAIAYLRGIDLRTSLTAVSLPIRGDSIQLQQVIMNLLLNAADAMAQSDPALRRILVSTKRVDRVAELSVSDTGPGIPSDRLASVFDPFFTTKASGMGMGLSIARSIVEAHGGEISVENGSEGGAIFRVKLPIDEQ
jgi:C4-dicarboxylate-specific signal transduction histidine kinase